MPNFVIIDSMIVVFDMDKTLTDDFGASVRPGIVGLLRRLVGDGIELCLWTNSTAERAREILSLHGLERFFTRFLFREDFDAKSEAGVPKDIRKIGAQFLVDADPMQIRFAQSVERGGFLITAYRGDAGTDERELEQIYAAITASQRKHRLLGWLR